MDQDYRTRNTEGWRGTNRDSWADESRAKQSPGRHRRRQTCFDTPTNEFVGFSSHSRLFMASLSSSALQTRRSKMSNLIPLVSSMMAESPRALYSLLGWPTYSNPTSRIEAMKSFVSLVDPNTMSTSLVATFLPMNVMAQPPMRYAAIFRPSFDPVSTRALVRSASVNIFDWVTRSTLSVGLKVFHTPLLSERTHPT